MIFPIEQLIEYNRNMYEVTCASARGVSALHAP
jgi:hypothetical protein